MTCGEAKQILMDLALQEAGPEARKRVQAHLEECDTCRGQLADLNLTRKLLVQGLPEEEVPRRIAFIAAPEGDATGKALPELPYWRSFVRSRAFTIPMGIAAAVALLVGALALAQTRVVGERGRWEVAFGGASRDATAGGARPAGLPAPQPVGVTVPLTREQAALLVAAAIRESEERQRAETATLVEAAAARLDKRHFLALTSLAEQMRYFERTQNIFYKETDQTRAALERVASRLPVEKIEKGERP